MKLKSLIVGPLVGFLMVFSVSAQAEVPEVRFARMTGLGYLQIYLLQDLKLVEKNAKEQGVDLVARYFPLGQPTAVNDALLSGSADFAAAGITPFITLWDKTRGNTEVKALAALNSQPAFLNTINPNVHSLKDFSEKDRIALPAVNVAFQATILQMAAELAFGQFDKLDTLTVGLSHADATNALLSGKSEITAHFTSPPYQYQQLENPKVHRVLSSYDVTGGPATFSGLWATTRFHDDNPKVVKVVLAALEEANAIIRSDPAKAAEIFVRLENAKQTPEEVATLLRDPDIQFTIAPQNITKYTAFMARVGSIRKAPNSWKDLFFANVHQLPGS
jgi:NitT/TauT family transport system substrate-binding protein